MLFFTMTPIQNTHAQREKSAFTLIELLTVVAVIGILAAIAIPAIGKVRQKAHASEAVSNIRQIGMAAFMYANDNKGVIPGHGKNADDNRVAAYLEGRLFPYIENRAVTSWEDLERTYEQLVDPAVPEVNIKDGSYTQAFNNLFSQRPLNGSDRMQPGRRLNEFEDPGEVLYAVTGTVEFYTLQGKNPAMLELPSDNWRWGIYYIHEGGTATPGVFLDGHAEMLSFPIEPKTIDPYYEGN